MRPARMTRNRNEHTSKTLATIASRVWKRGYAKPKEAMSMAGSLMTQALDKRRKSRRKSK
jgi:hypothetical protein